MNNRLPSARYTVADTSRRTAILNTCTRPGFPGRAVFVTLLFLLTFGSGGAFGADALQAAVIYRPGDTIRVLVTFKEPVNLKAGNLRLLLNGDLPQGQKVFDSQIYLNTLSKSSEREYDFETKVTEHMASGTYRLIYLAATDLTDFTRSFDIGPDFASVTIAIRNDKHVEFPDIKSIRVDGHREGNL